MDSGYLENYHNSQKEIILRNKGNLIKQKYVKSYKDVYPDVHKRLNHKKGIAYIRGSVPLKAMVLIYDVVIVSIPPLSKEAIEKRFSVTFDELIQLCEVNLVIPVITDATEYTAPYFDQLFELLNPPCSLWARGLGLLEAFNIENTLDVARDALPVSDISNDQSIYSHWARRLSTSDVNVIKNHIEDNVATLYADLCIFGFEDEARKLADKSPSYIYNRLRKMNEILTFPVLFGMGSQPNYSTSKILDINDATRFFDNKTPFALPERDLRILLGGIGININSVSVEEIIAYHNDGLGISLRNALNSFNEEMDTSFTGAVLNVNPPSLFSKAETVQIRLEKALNELDYEKINDIDKKMTMAFRIGSVSVGWIAPIIANHPMLAPVFGSAGFVAQFTSIPEDLSFFLMQMGLRGFKSKFAANMWIANRTVLEH